MTITPDIARTGWTASHNAGELTVVDAAKAKYSCIELQGRVLDICVQLRGGYGYMAEYPSPARTSMRGRPGSTAVLRKS